MVRRQPKIVRCCARHTTEQKVIGNKPTAPWTLSRNLRNMRHLINNDGAPFESAELQTLRGELDALDDNGRTEYRNQNASAIARHEARKFLIVSGPGTGKSTLLCRLHRIGIVLAPDARRASLVRMLDCTLSGHCAEQGMVFFQRSGLPLIPGIEGLCCNGRLGGRPAGKTGSVPAVLRAPAL